MNVMHSVYLLVAWFNAFMLLYFLTLNANYTLLFFLGRAEVNRYVRRRALRNYGALSDSELSQAVSVLMPAYNEQPVIVESVRSMLGLHYANLEVVVINDGSTDDTLEVLKAAYALVRVSRVPRAGLPTANVRGVYISPTDSRLVVIDKGNGGKADSLNAGLNYACFPLFCSVDGDTLLDREGLARLVWQFQSDPETVAVGGIVRIVNGSTVKDSIVVDVRAPKGLLLNLQVVEYLRAFLIGRTGWSRLNSLLIISGAFGLFRRDIVVEVGGYRTDTVGEDAELVVRLHHHCYDRKLPHRVTFIADPVCWTEAPASLKVLGRQRNRWQRGLMETLWLHKGMLARPKYGMVGLFALPYFIVFEALGPLIELTGYAVFIFSLCMRWVSGEFCLVLLFLAFGYGLLLSLGALYIEESSFQRYHRRSDLVRLVCAAVIENVIYRQWHTFVRAQAFFTMLRSGAHWGEMTRTGFSATAPGTLISEPAGSGQGGDPDALAPEEPLRDPAPATLLPAAL